MYYIILSVAVLVMLYVMITYVRIKKMPEGTPMMIKLAGIIRGGSKTFLRIRRTGYGMDVLPGKGWNWI